MHSNVHHSTIYNSQDMETSAHQQIIGLRKCGVYTHMHTRTHTMEYYSDIKKNEILPFAATLMDLEYTIRSKVSQAEKDI